MARQPNKYTEEEIVLIKNTFNGREDLGLALRNYILQLPAEQQLVNELQGPALVELYRKAFLAVPTGKEPNGFLGNIYDSMQLSGRLPEQAEPDIRSSDKAYKFIEQQIDRLAGKNPKTQMFWEDMRDVDSAKDDLELLVNIMAYQKILHTVQATVNVFMVFAEKKNETAEQMVERLRKDSTR